MKRYLLTAEASALLQEHLLPCHLDGAIGTCPGGPEFPEQLGPHKWPPKPIHKWQNFNRKKKKEKIQFLCHVKFSGIGCRKNGAEGQSSEVTSSFSWEAQSCVWNLGQSLGLNCAQMPSSFGSYFDSVLLLPHSGFHGRLNRRTRHQLSRCQLQVSNAIVHSMK